MGEQIRTRGQIPPNSEIKSVSRAVILDKKEQIFVLNVRKNPNHPPANDDILLGRKFKGRAERLSSSFSLKSKMPPVLNQLTLGACVSNSTCILLSYIYKKKRGKFYNGSRLFMYFNARGTDAIAESDPDQIVEDLGLFIIDGILATKNYGAPEETTCPYEVDQFAYLPGSKAYARGQLHKTITYASLGNTVSDVTTIKLKLQKQLPVLMGIYLFENFYDSSVTYTGDIQLPAGDFVGGHALVIVGWNDDTERF